MIIGYKAIIPPQELGEHTYVELRTSARTFVCRFTPSIMLHMGTSRIISFIPGNSMLTTLTAENGWIYDD